MASVITTPASPTTDPTPAGSTGHTPLTGDVGLAAVLGAGLTAIAFLTKASFGVAGGAQTGAQIALVLVCAAVAVTVLVVGGRGPAWGVGTLGLLVALTALTFLSILWSVQPDASWLAGNLTLSYLAAFACGLVLARVLPTRWRAIIGAIAISSVALGGWALLTKVFPAALDAGDTMGRLSAPLGYWNAVGLSAAMGLPVCLWAGGRRDASRVLRTLALPAIAVLLTVLVLSYGRGALVAAALGLALWFAVVPFRLRAAAILLLGGAGAAVVTGWALGSHALTDDNVTLAARVSSGRTFGVVLGLTLIALTVIGHLAAPRLDTIAVSPQTRRRLGLALIGVAALVPLGAVAAVAASSRGLTGEISHVWNDFTSPNGGTSNQPGRLVALGSSRPRYWREGLLIGEHSPVGGAGAAAFATASLRYDRNRWDVTSHAHSYVIETFADLGLVGLALTLALLVAWALAAARAVGARGPRPGPEHAAERVGMLTLLAVVVIFGLQSTIDWTWFVPGVAVPALLAAAWLAGRGPLAQRVGRRESPRSLRATPELGVVLVSIAVLTTVAIWSLVQPWRASRAESAALTAAVNGDTKAAFVDAREASTDDPLSAEPLLQLSSLYRAVGDQSRARGELSSASSLQPDNPETWQLLGEYDLASNRARLALSELARARQLDPASTVVQQDLATARAAAG